MLADSPSNLDASDFGELDFIDSSFGARVMMQRAETWERFYRWKRLVLSELEGVSLRLMLYACLVLLFVKFFCLVCSFKCFNLRHCVPFSFG